MTNHKLQVENIFDELQYIFAISCFSQAELGDDEFKRRLSELQLVTVGKRVLSALRQFHRTIDKSAIGASQVFNEILAALDDNLSMATRNSCRRIVLREVYFRFDPAIWIGSPDQTFTIEIELKKSGHLVRSHDHQSGSRPLGGLSGSAIGAESIISR